MMMSLPCTEDVMEDTEVEVRGQGRNGRSGQLLPDEVPREGWMFLVHMRAVRVRHPIPLDEGGPGGRQEGTLTLRPPRQVIFFLTSSLSVANFEAFLPAKLIDGF